VDLQPLDAKRGEGVVRRQADRPAGEAAAPVRAEQREPGATTPETYLGWLRAQGFEDQRIAFSTHDFGPGGGAPGPDRFRFRGRWTFARERATARAAAGIDAHVGARRVFIVLGSPDRPRRVRVLLDGRPLPDRFAGPDVRDGVVRVGAQRLYRLVDFGRVERRVVTLEFDPGVAGYAFTFG
jgi:hypothetical protein